MINKKRRERGKKKNIPFSLENVREGHGMEWDSLYCKVPTTEK